MSETKGYRVWYRHRYNYSSGWIQAVVIEAHEVGVLAIDANGEVIGAYRVFTLSKSVENYHNSEFKGILIFYYKRSVYPLKGRMYDCN